MTDEQKANDANRYIVVREDSGEICGAYDAEGEARKKAEMFAAYKPEIGYIVYQKIGSALAETKVSWKGAAR